MKTTVYIDLQDGKPTLWDSPGPGRSECTAIISETGDVLISSHTDAVNDLTTHRDAWRNAIETAHGVADERSEDQDDKSYWKHELDVFDRTFGVLAE